MDRPEISLALEPACYHADRLSIPLAKFVVSDDAYCGLLLDAHFFRLDHGHAQSWSFMGVAVEVSAKATDWEAYDARGNPLRRTLQLHDSAVEVARATSIKSHSDARTALDPQKTED